MRVDQDFDVRPGDLANAGGELGGDLLALLAHAAVEIDVIGGADPVEMRERIELQRGMPRIDDGADFLHHAFIGAEIAAVRVRVEQDVVAHLAAEQLVDRLAQHLAANVPQRDVDAADHVGRRAARTGVGERAERLVPKPLDLRRVLADQQLVELADDARDGAVGDLRRGRDLAPAGDAFIGADLHEEVFAPIRACRLHQPRHQLRDLHGSDPLSGCCSARGRMSSQRRCRQRGTKSHATACPAGQCTAAIPTTGTPEAPGRRVLSRCRASSSRSTSR